MCDRELKKVRDSFFRDLEKLRETASRAEERLRASEKRALLEIDRESSAAAKAQKEVVEAARRAVKREAEHRRIVETLQVQQGDARHQSGVLQGKLAGLEAAHTSLQEHLKSLRGAARPSARGPTKAGSSPTAKRVVSRKALGKTVMANEPT